MPHIVCSHVTYHSTAVSRQDGENRNIGDLYTDSGQGSTSSRFSPGLTSTKVSALLYQMVAAHPLRHLSCPSGNPQISIAHLPTTEDTCALLRDNPVQRLTNSDPRTAAWLRHVLTQNPHLDRPKPSCKPNTSPGTECRRPATQIRCRRRLQMGNSYKIRSL